VPLARTPDDITCVKYVTVTTKLRGWLRHSGSTRLWPSWTWDATWSKTKELMLCLRHSRSMRHWPLWNWPATWSDPLALSHCLRRSRETQLWPLCTAEQFYLSQRSSSTISSTQNELISDHLGFVGSSIGDNGAQALAEALKMNSTLTTLCLQNNSIGDIGAQALYQELQVNSTLTTLDLWQNSVTDKGAMILCKVSHICFVGTQIRFKRTSLCETHLRFNVE